MSDLTLRVLSYNIHKGFSTGNQRFVLNLIKESIRPLGANLVFLQEVIGEHQLHAARVKEWPTQSQFEYLADDIWSHYAYGKNAVYSSGHHGNAILSAFPIINWSNSNISTNQLESRGLLHAVVEIPLCADTQSSPTIVHCFCVHLSLFQQGRERQIKNIAHIIMSEVGPDAPFILAGDFNDWRGYASKVLEELTGATEVFNVQLGAHARTYPAALPFLRLDRIYTRGMRIENVCSLAGNPWNRLSDHIALFAELKLF